MRTIVISSDQKGWMNGRKIIHTPVGSENYAAYLMPTTGHSEKVWNIRILRFALMSLSG